MKALLLKDWYLLKKSCWSIALIMVIWAVIPQTFLNNFAIIYGAMVPYTVMAYDQRSRWDRYTRILPIRDRDVVLSRYVLGWLSLLCGAVLVCLAQGVLSCFHGEVTLSLSAVLAALSVGCILLDLNIPMILRFGTEKARWLSILIIACTCASAGALGSVPFISAGSYLPGLRGVAGATRVVMRLLMTAAAPTLALLATAVSIPLSLRFYRQNRV